MRMAPSLVRLCAALGVALTVVLGVVLSAAQTSVPSNPQLQEARRAYDTTDFESARAVLTSAIAQFGPNGTCA